MATLQVKDATGTTVYLKETGAGSSGDPHIPSVIVDSSGLPTGASTAAKQPALGTAGTASTDVITVQGIASGTAQPVNNAGTFAVQDSQVIADDAAFTIATSKVFAAGFLADETATDSVDEGDVGVARMSLDRKQHAIVEFESASMRASGVALTPKFAAIAAATSGDNSLVAAVSAKKIRVLAMFILAGAAGNIYFTSAASGTVIFGGSTNKICLATNTGFVLPFNPLGWFENSSTNQALVMNASSTGPFSGGLVYVEV